MNNIQYCQSFIVREPQKCYSFPCRIINKIILSASDTYIFGEIKTKELQTL